MAVETAEVIQLDTLAQFIDTGKETTAEQDLSSDNENDYSSALADFETRYLKSLLQKTGGNVEAAAREAGMNMATIYRKLKKYEISREDFS